MASLLKTIHLRAANVTWTRRGKELTATAAFERAAPVTTTARCVGAASTP